MKVRKLGEVYFVVFSIYISFLSIAYAAPGVVIRIKNEGKYMLIEAQTGKMVDLKEHDTFIDKKGELRRIISKGNGKLDDVKAGSLEDSISQFIYYKTFYAVSESWPGKNGQVNK
jgi:hypothetical protein